MTRGTALADPRDILTEGHIPHPVKNLNRPVLADMGQQVCGLGLVSGEAGDVQHRLVAGPALDGDGPFDQEHLPDVREVQLGRGGQDLDGTQFVPAPVLVHTPRGDRHAGPVQGVEPIEQGGLVVQHREHEVRVLLLAQPPGVLTLRLHRIGSHHLTGQGPGASTTRRTHRSHCSCPRSDAGRARPRHTTARPAGAARRGGRSSRRGPSSRLPPPAATAAGIGPAHWPADGVGQQLFGPAAGLATGWRPHPGPGSGSRRGQSPALQPPTHRGIQSVTVEPGAQPASRDVSAAQRPTS